MKLDAKKKKLLIIGGIVLLLLLLWAVRGRKRAEANNDVDKGAFDYGTYNLPAIVGGNGPGSNYDFGDIITNNSNGGSPLDLDALGNKLCGCMNKCGLGNGNLGELDNYAFTVPFNQIFSGIIYNPSSYTAPSYTTSTGFAINNVPDSNGIYTYNNWGAGAHIYGAPGG
jgi:hypothetical protein